MKRIENPDDVRATIQAAIESARSMESIYRRQITEAEEKAAPYQRERWALEGVLSALDADVPANDEAPVDGLRVAS